jgi:hypothetical protein
MSCLSFYKGNSSFISITLRGEGARHQGSGTLNNPSEILDVGCFVNVTMLGEFFSKNIS